MRRKTRNPVTAMLITHLALAFVVLIVQPSNADAVIIRVAPSGADVAGCGSATTPCRTPQYAVDLADGGDEVRLAGGTYTGVNTHLGTTQVVWIYNKYITMRGGFTTSNWVNPNPVANPTILDAQGLGMVFFIRYPDWGWNRTTLEGLRITGGNATTAVSGEDDGGGVHVETIVHMHVTIDNCIVSGNSAESGAGGIFSTGSPGLEVLNSTIEDNTGYGIKTSMVDSVTVTGCTVRNHPDAGIAIFTAHGTTTITGNDVTDNSPGIRINSAIGGSVSGNTVTGNVSDSGGGGMYITGGNPLTVSDNYFFDNEGTSAGALYLSGNATVENNIAISNRAPHLGYLGGGGFYIDAGSTGHIDVIGNTVQDNYSRDGGGGMVLLGSIFASGNLIIDNTTGGSGGGIQASIMGTLEENRLVGNTALQGGGLSLGPFEVDLVRNYFFQNHATSGSGGGAYIFGWLAFNVSLDGDRVIGNSASDKGGGIYMESQVDESETTVENLLVQDNTAPTASGMYLLGGTTEMDHCTFVNNGKDSGDGVGLYNRVVFTTGNVTLTNSIIAGQETGVYVHNGSATIDRILWGDGAWANTSDYAGGSVTASNEIWADPRFGSTGGEGYHIDGTSAARDAGTDIGVLVDMDGEPRPNPDTGIPDLGADEWSDQFDVFSDGFESGNTSAWS